MSRDCDCDNDGCGCLIVLIIAFLFYQIGSCNSDKPQVIIREVEKHGQLQ